MRAWMVVGALLLAGTGHAQTLTPLDALPQDARMLNLHSVGRTQLHRTGKHLVSYVHQWPGIYFETVFEGDRAYLGFDDPTNEYRLYVDSQPPIAIVKPGKTWLELDKIGTGPHHMRLEKVTESIDQTGAFNGAYTSAAGRAAPAPAPRTRSIEFIGDSGMTGYGTRSKTTKCTKQEVHDLTDTQQDFTVLTAKNFDADYEINAISGRGLVRNYDGAVPGQELPQLYPYTFYDKTVPVSDRQWHPNVVIVSLGGNDFSTTLKPGDVWKSQDQLLQQVLFAYSRFVVALHRRYPKASIVLFWPFGADDAQGRQFIDVGRKSIEAAAAQAGAKRLFFITASEIADLSHTERTGCDYHGSLDDQKKAAQATIGWLNAHPDVW